MQRSTLKVLGNSIAKRGMATEAQCKLLIIYNVFLLYYIYFFNIKEG